MTGLATAEDFRAAAFEAVPGVEIPRHNKWMERAGEEHKVLRLGLASLRFSNQELAKIVRDTGDLTDWISMLDSLDEIEKFHTAVLETIGAIQARLLAAMCQAYPDPDEAV